MSVFVFVCSGSCVCGFLSRLRGLVSLSQPLLSRLLWFWVGGSWAQMPMPARWGWKAAQLAEQWSCAWVFPPWFVAALPS